MIRGNLGIVVIGRNEAARLGACLDAATGAAPAVVYVDSGSTDGSPDVARWRGVPVVALDAALPFTAARARNAGLAWLRRTRPGLEYVQFVDGDCELAPGWIDAARAFLAAHPDVATAAGRLRELDPGRSIYNALCNVEWDVPAGEAAAPGGVFLAREAALAQAGDFREALVAGEEPELARRMQAAGWRHWRLDEAMATHDAALHRFAPWWHRMARSGCGFAQGSRLGGSEGPRPWAREIRSAFLWAVGLPLAVLASWPAVGAKGLILLLAYPAQAWRMAWRDPRLSRGQALLLLLGKFAQVAGYLRCRWRQP